MAAGVRDYDPTTGTWMQPDPMGVDGGINLYRYAEGDRVNATDPSGYCVSADTPEWLLEQQREQAELSFQRHSGWDPRKGDPTRMAMRPAKTTCDQGVGGGWVNCRGESENMLEREMNARGDRSFRAHRSRHRLATQQRREALRRSAEAEAARAVERFAALRYHQANAKTMAQFGLTTDDWLAMSQYDRSQFASGMALYGQVKFLSAVSMAIETDSDLVWAGHKGSGLPASLKGALAFMSKDENDGPGWVWSDDPLSKDDLWHAMDLFEAGREEEMKDPPVRRTALIQNPDDWDDITTVDFVAFASEAFDIMQALESGNPTDPGAWKARWDFENDRINHPAVDRDPPPIHGEVLLNTLGRMIGETLFMTFPHDEDGTKDRVLESFRVADYPPGMDQAGRQAENWLLGATAVLGIGHGAWSISRWAAGLARTAATTPAAAATSGEFIGPLIGSRTQAQTLQEFTHVAYANYQRYADDAYSSVISQLASGRLQLKNNGIPRATQIGSLTDRRVRARLRNWATTEFGGEGPGQFMAVNRYLRAPSGGRYRVPDFRVPGHILDLTVGLKAGNLPQIIDFRTLSGGAHVTIVRPSSMGSYSLLP